MYRMNSGAPLLSLDAVVIDTETTGLDPRKARVIEVAACDFRRKLDAGGSFRQLLRPAGESSRPETTRIHASTTPSVRNSPPFADVWPGFSAFLGQAVVSGTRSGSTLRC